MVVRTRQATSVSGNKPSFRSVVPGSLLSLDEDGGFDANGAMNDDRRYQRNVEMSVKKSERGLQSEYKISLTRNLYDDMNMIPPRVRRKYTVNCHCWAELESVVELRDLGCFFI